MSNFFLLCHYRFQRLVFVLRKKAALSSAGTPPPSVAPSFDIWTLPCTYGPAYITCMHLDMSWFPQIIKRIELLCRGAYVNINRGDHPPHLSHRQWGFWHVCGLKLTQAGHARAHAVVIVYVVRSTLVVTRSRIICSAHLRERILLNMATAIVLSEQSTSQLTFTSICGESSSASLSGLENGNGSSYADYGAKNGGILPRKAEPEVASTLSRSQKLESSESGAKLRGDDAERRYKLCLRAEVVGLCVVIVIVWGLLLLPIIFYHLPLSASVSDKPSHINAITIFTT